MDIKESIAKEFEVSLKDITPLHKDFFIVWYGLEITLLVNRVTLIGYIHADSWIIAKDSIDTDTIALFQGYFNLTIVYVDVPFTLQQIRALYE